MKLPVVKYSETQPRDEHGRFSDGGGAGTSPKNPPKPGAAPVSVVPSGGTTSPVLPAALASPATAAEINAAEGRLVLSLVTSRTAIDALDAQRDYDPAPRTGDREEAYRLLKWVAKDAGLNDPPGFTRELNAHGGNIVSGIEYHREKDAYVIDLLASLEPGQGVAWIHEVEQRAFADGLGVRLESLPSARGFYRKMGYTLSQRAGHLWDARKSAFHVEASIRNPKKALRLKVVLDDKDGDVGVLAVTEAVLADIRSSFTLDARRITSGPLWIESTDEDKDGWRAERRG